MLSATITEALEAATIQLSPKTTANGTHSMTPMWHKYPWLLLSRGPIPTSFSTSVCMIDPYYYSQTSTSCIITTSYSQYLFYLYPLGPSEGTDCSWISESGHCSALCQLIRTWVEFLWSSCIHYPLRIFIVAQDCPDIRPVVSWVVFGVQFGHKANVGGILSSPPFWSQLEKWCQGFNLTKWSVHHSILVEFPISELWYISCAKEILHLLPSISHGFV